MPTVSGAAVNPESFLTILKAGKRYVSEYSFPESPRKRHMRQKWKSGFGCVDFRDGNLRKFKSSAYPEYQFADLKILTNEQAFIEGMESFGKKIKGFDRPDAILAGVESRTSSPVRIPRGETLESSVRGLYPCGEGAGYAGGITSAAMDGLKVAEELIRRYKLTE
ncbi:MAG: FAD-dependent protein [Clostridium sp.]